MVITQSLTNFNIGLKPDSADSQFQVVSDKGLANKIIKSTGLVYSDISKAKLNNEKLTKRAYMRNMCDMRYPNILIMILYQSFNSITFPLLLI